MNSIVSTGCLALFVVIPALFWTQGRRFFGSQTHPAALFILSWIASFFVLSMANVLKSGTGTISLLWVSLVFGILSIVRNLQKKREKKAPGGEGGTGEG